MLRGLPASIILHLAIVGTGYIAFPYTHSPAQVVEIVPVDIVTVSEVTNVVARRRTEEPPEAETDEADVPEPEPEPDLEEFLEDFDALPEEVEDVVEEEAPPPPPDKAEEKAPEDVVPEEPEEKEPEPEEKKPEPKKEEPKASSVASTSGDYVVQLASIKDKSLAEKEWQKFVSKYGSALSGMSYRVQTADLGDKGLFHRIQAGPVSKEKASSVCAAIKQISPGGCIVKKK